MPVAHFCPQNKLRITCWKQYKWNSLSVSGMEMITPFPVPTQRRFPPIRSAVIRTKEKPSLPVPVNYNQSQWRTTSDNISFSSKVKTSSHPASCSRMAQCPHPGGAGVCVRDTDAGSSLTGSTPTHHRRSTLAAAPDFPCEDGRRRTSAERWKRKSAHYHSFISLLDLAGWCDGGFTSICMLLGWMTWILFL